MSYEVFYKIELSGGRLKEGLYIVEADNEDDALEIGEDILKSVYARSDYEILELFAVPE